MKKWNAPEMVELNINETANGGTDFLFESGRFDTNPDGITHEDSDGDGNGWCPIHNNTPDTLSQCVK